MGDQAGVLRRTGADDRNRLGRAAAGRFTRPRHGARMPAALGSVAVAAQRFAAGVARPIEIRRQLAGPGEIKPRPFEPVAQPPRWWVPEGSPGDGASHTDAPARAARWSAGATATPASLPPRGLPRAARSVPTESNHVPGGFAATMRGAPIRVRRVKEVTEAGSMAGAGEKLVPPAESVGPSGGRSPARPPGAGTGDGSAHRPVAGAVPRSAQHGPAGVRPPGRTSLLRRAWAGQRGDAQVWRDNASRRTGTVGSGGPSETERAARSGETTGAGRTPTPPTAGSGARPGVGASSGSVVAQPGSAVTGPAPIRRQTAVGDGGSGQALSGSPSSPTVSPAARSGIAPAPSSPAPSVPASVPAGTTPSGSSAGAGNAPFPPPGAGVGRPGGEETVGPAPGSGTSGSSTVRRTVAPAAAGSVASSGQAGAGAQGIGTHPGVPGTEPHVPQAIPPLLAPASAGSPWQSARSPRMPAELATSMVRRRTALGAGGDALVPLRRAADQLPGPGPQALSSMAPASAIRPRQHGGIPRPPTGFRPGGPVVARSAVLAQGRAMSPSATPSQHGASGIARGPVRTVDGGAPAPGSSMSAAAVARPVVRRSSGGATPAGPVAPGPSMSAAAVASTAPASPGAPAPSTPSAAPGSQAYAPAAVTGGPGPTPSAGRHARITAALGHRPGSSAPLAGQGVSVPVTAGVARASLAAANAVAAGPTPALRRMPGGLVRRHAAAIARGIARPGGERIDTTESTLGALSRGASTRGPVLLRSMSAVPAGLRGGMAGSAEIVPSTSRLLAGATVGAPSAGAVRGRHRVEGPEATAGTHRGRPAGSAARSGGTEVGPVTGTLRASAAATAATFAPGGGARTGDATGPSGIHAATAFNATTTGAGAPSPVALVSAGTVRRFATAEAGSRPGAVPVTTGAAGTGGTGPAARFISAAGVPGVVRRSRHAASSAVAAGSADPWAVQAATLAPGVVGALITGAASPTAVRPAAGVQHPAGSGATSGTAVGVPRLVRRTAAHEIVPAAGAVLRAATPRLAVLPLPLRTAGTGSAGAGDRRASVGGAETTAARSGRTATALSGVPTRSGPLPSRPGPAPIRRSAAGDGQVPTGGATSPAAATSPNGTAADGRSIPPGTLGSPPVPGTAASGLGSPTAVPWITGLPDGSVVRRTFVGAGGHRATVGAEIRPVTAELLRSGRVAPPRGLPIASAATNAATSPPPAAPASVVGGPAERVIKRSPARPARPSTSPTSDAVPTGTADVSLIRRVPASLFDRARAELRSAAGSFDGSPVRAAGAAGTGGGVVRRVPDDQPSGGLPVTSSGAGSTPGEPVESSLSSREWDQLVDEVVRRLEGRIADELARRGRRFTPRSL